MQTVLLLLLAFIIFSDHLYRELQEKPAASSLVRSYTSFVHNRS